MKIRATVNLCPASLKKKEMMKNNNQNSKVLRMKEVDMIFIKKEEIRKIRKARRARRKAAKRRKRSLDRKGRRGRVRRRRKISHRSSGKTKNKPLGDRMIKLS